MMKIAYKVVERWRCGTRWIMHSLVVGGNASVEYELGVPVTGILGPLFLFDTLEAARETARRRPSRSFGDDGIVILECEISNVVPTPYLVASEYYTIHFPGFWEVYQRAIDGDDVDTSLLLREFSGNWRFPPDGTVLAWTVTPIRIIEEES